MQSYSALKFEKTGGGSLKNVFSNHFCSEKFRQLVIANYSYLVPGSVRNLCRQGLEKWIAFRLPGRLAPESDIAFQTPRARGNRRADCRLKSARMPFGIQHSIAHSNIKFQKY